MIALAPKHVLEELTFPSCSHLIWIAITLLVSVHGVMHVACFLLPSGVIPQFLHQIDALCETGLLITLAFRPLCVARVRERDQQVLLTEYILDVSQSCLESCVGIYLILTAVNLPSL